LYVNSQNQKNIFVNIKHFHTFALPFKRWKGNKVLLYIEIINVFQQINISGEVGEWLKPIRQLAD